MRGSIPVYWRQETSATNPKPPIIIQRQDPTYKMTTLHFQDLFSRYATPIICLGKYFKRRERASRNGSTVADISIPPPSFKPVSLYLSRSPPF